MFNYRRIFIIAVWIVSVLPFTSLSGRELDHIFNPIWLGNAPKKDFSENGWRQNGFLLKAFDVADRQVSDILKEHGFTVKNHSETKKNMKRCKISLWRKTDCQIIVMLVEQEIGKTLFSWGVINDAK